LNFKINKKKEFESDH